MINDFEACSFRLKRNINTFCFYYW